MEKKTIVAQVDYATEQIMRDISGNITSAIDQNLQRIKNDIGTIEDVYSQTEDIIEKLNNFDGLSSSLADLKEFAKESRTLAKTISPLESQIANIKNIVTIGIEKNENKANDVISSAKENLTYSQTTLKPLSQSANDKLDSMLSSLAESEDKVTKTIEHGVSSIKDTYTEGLRSIQNSIERVSQKLQNVEENIDQKTSDLEKRINDVQDNLTKIAQQNEAQLNTLKESIEKIQATLDIVVNLTTPFWKKWSK